MKKIINGFRYDTTKSIEVGSASHGYIRSGDFSAWEATLYKTPRSGRFFLAGEGGPMTTWARRVDQNSWCGGDGIIPMSKEEALGWAEQNLSEDEIEEHFGDDIEDA
jgi:hypothetical protein